MGYVLLRNRKEKLPLRGGDKVVKAKYFSFSKKMTIIFCIPLLIISLITALISSESLQRNLNKEIKGSLQIVADSLESTYSTLYEGDYTLDRTFSLYKGDTKISGKTTLLDALEAGTGIMTSFYFEDRIILTTLKMESGGRATGLKLEKEIYEQILSGESVFNSNYELQGEIYFGYFKPLTNDDDSIVGVIFAGKRAEEVRDRISGEILRILLPIIGIMVVFLLIVFLFARYLAKNMIFTKEFLKEVAEGNLYFSENKIKSRDEIGEIFRISVYLQKKLHEIVTRIKISANKLMNSSGKLRVMSHSLYQNILILNEELQCIVQDALKQAKETTESVENINHINTQIEFVSQGMETMHQTIDAVACSGENAYSLICELHQSNIDATSAVEQIAKQIENVDISVQLIQTTIDIIREIADETNLLSINAGIEAAHAGSNGKGFAVIAEQIGKLASQSAQNAVNVEKTIFKLKGESEKTISTMEEVRSKMKIQSSKLDESMKDFASVEKGLKETEQGVKIITEKMEKLKYAKEIILEKILVLSDISDNFAAATGRMGDNADSLNQMMGEIEKTSRYLDSISEELCCGLDMFKC